MPGTSVAVAFMNRRDGDHERVAAWMQTVEEDLRSGAYLVEWWPEAVAESAKTATQNADIGLADVSLLALAARLPSTRVATLDERHFRTRPLTGEAAFTLLPADA